MFELPIGLQNRVGVDCHFGHHLFDGRKLVADREDSHSDGLFDLLYDLQVCGYP